MINALPSQSHHGFEMHRRDDKSLAPCGQERVGYTQLMRVLIIGCGYVGLPLGAE